MNVALVLPDRLPVTALLKVDVTQVNNGRLKFRIEQQCTVVFSRGTFVPSSMLKRHAEAVVRIGFGRRKLHVALMRRNGLVIASQAQITDA